MMRRRCRPASSGCRHDSIERLTIDQLTNNAVDRDRRDPVSDFLTAPTTCLVKALIRHAEERRHMSCLPRPQHRRPGQESGSDICVLRPIAHLRYGNVNSNTNRIIGMRGLSFFKSALAAGVMASVSGLSVAAPSFDFSLLHEPYVADGNASAINDAGDVVGRWPYATFWRNGVGLNLDDAFNGSSDVYGLNNLGDAVGHSGDGFGVATLWRNQIPTQLPTPEGWRSTAFDVNDAGYIVGMHEAIGSSGYPRAVVWQIDSMTELAMPDGATASFANAINNGGQIVGGSGHSANSSRATLWQEGEATLLQTLGGSISYANDINNLGQIAGASYLGNGGIGLHATL
jgi:probable HAF family extracellular repeat protein